MRKKYKNMSLDEIEKEIKNLWLELAKERGRIKVGGIPENPSKIRVIKKDIARLLTRKNEIVKFGK